MARMPTRSVNTGCRFPGSPVQPGTTGASTQRVRLDQTILNAAGYVRCSASEPPQPLSKLIRTDSAVST